MHGPKWMNLNDFGDPLTFPLAPPWGWHLWFRVKYLDSYWRDCHETCYRYSRSLKDKFSWLWWSSDFSFGTTFRSEFSLIQWNISTSMMDWHKISYKHSRNDFDDGVYGVVYPSIHPLSIPLVLNRATGVLEPIPAVIGRAAGYALDRLPVSHRAFMVSFFIEISQECLDGWPLSFGRDIYGYHMNCKNVDPFYLVP